LVRINEEWNEENKHLSKRECTNYRRECDCAEGSCKEHERRRAALEKLRALQPEVKTLES